VSFPLCDCWMSRGDSVNCQDGSVQPMRPLNPCTITPFNIASSQDQPARVPLGAVNRFPLGQKKVQKDEQKEAAKR